MNAGDEITITPTELVAGGAAIARVDGFPIFATNVYPGDVAVVRLLEVKKGFAHADLVRVIEPSPFRRAMPCPVASECGGCDWTALRLDKQLEAKQRILTESLRRIGKIDPATLPPIAIHPSPLNYRLRSRLHRDGDKVGFYAMRTNDVVPLPRECEVVGAQTREHPREGETWEVDGKLVAEGEMVIDGYHVTTDAFFQVNRHLLGTMRELVTKLAMRVSGVGCPVSENANQDPSDPRPPTPGSRTTALDLYSGVGFFTRPLAELFEHVTAIEGAEAAHECAKRNVPANVTLVNAPVEWWVNRMPRADFVFLDPPRSGARRNVIDAIAERATAMVCFLACDPVTFARDASRLIASGWRLASLDLLDLFPNTHHVETLASFERA
ncbi:MAG: class I SAM-dependent RNA methyltransferase [Acidobacteria bacterium]|nr:class I SAM-dependent RNA methyltransferase [Acidobacteriota bacterium]MBV9184412.1 class I SAM-dependent RNA methyltransferase [Acidobacteriota bacterium]